jgi:hypothetical protein
VDLAAELLVGEVVADEDGPDHPAEFLDGLVGGLLGAAAGEAAQHLVGLGGAQPQRGRVLDHLVVVTGDDVPVDGLARQHAVEPGPRLVLPEARPVQPG